MDLHFREYGSGPPLVILHGLFGSGDNWASFSKRLGEFFTVYALDLRNHGQSPHAVEMNYETMASDVHRFMQSQWIHQGYVMGHSMGGKVAMQLALHNPDLVAKLIVVDMGIKAYDGGHESIFEAMLNLPIEQLSSRKEAEDFLIKRIKEPAVVQFLLKNIHYDLVSSKYQWKINLPVIYEHYADILSALETQGLIYRQPALFVRGERSNYILDTDWPHIQKTFISSELATIKGAGHWVHADQPAELFDCVVNFLGR